LKYKNTEPKVSIGLPVYNGAKTIEKAINSLLVQTFKEFELIISDNASDDETSRICKEFLLKDSRIKYIRQLNNIGGLSNFQFVLKKARGRYFKWIGADDWISPDFLEINLLALQSNPNYVASTSPNCFVGEENNFKKQINFNLVGTHKERFVKFFQNAFISHGTFYSLIRTEIIKNYEHFYSSGLAWDWYVHIFLLNKGEINRTKQGLAVIGFGISTAKDSWKKLRQKSVEIFIPLYYFSKYTLCIIKNLNYYEWTYVFVKLLKLNLQAMKSSYIMSIKNFINKG
jgi:glycosyltransferase involved in cell wall biosynthesis